MVWDFDEAFVATWAVERGDPLITDDGAGLKWYVHPADWLLQRGKGRYPFETRHSAGMIELERDRRRHP